MPPEQNVRELARFFQAYGDSTRLGILLALGMREMCVCDLACLLKMTKSAISHQLRTLRQANLVKFRKEGKIAFYSLADDHVRTTLTHAIDHVGKTEREEVPV
jgi:ArsR family transcriptional regulator